MNNETAQVGIFFNSGNDFLIDAVPLADGEPYGDAIGYSGHYVSMKAMNHPRPRTPLQGA